MSFSTKLWSHVIAAAAGAATAYYYDPDRGRSRRTRTRDQVLAAGRDMTRDVEKQARYYEGKAQGVRARVDGQGELHPVDDHVVKQGIQQKLSSVGADTSDVVIDVTDGVVGLRGKAPSQSELDKIELAAMDVPGVEEVKSWLHLPNQVAPNKARAVEASRSG